MQGQNEAQTINQDENFNDLVSMGFDPILVARALKVTNDKERAIELVLKYQDEVEAPITAPTDNKPQEGNQASKTEEQKLQDGLANAIKAINARAFNTMNYKMVLVVRQDLQMGVGKVAAQVGHAVLGAYKNIINNNDLRHKEALFNWEECGQAKIVLKIKNKEDMIALEAKAAAAGLNTYLVADAGRTQVEPGSITVCAIGPANSTELDPVTGHLRLM